MEGQRLDITVAELRVKVKTIEQVLVEYKIDQTALHEELSLLRQSSTRLCTVLEQMEKRMCPDPGACVSVKKDLDSLKEFQNKIIGGAVVISAIGAMLGVIGGWLLAVWMYHHGNQEAASALTGAADRGVDGLTNTQMLAQSSGHVVR